MELEAVDSYRQRRELQTQQPVLRVQGSRRSLVVSIAKKTYSGISLKIVQAGPKVQRIILVFANLAEPYAPFASVPA